MGIEVSGVSQALAALAKVDASVRAALAQSVTDEAEQVAQDERDAIAVLTGAAQAGIQVRALGELAAEVGIYDPELVYVIWLEWGRSSAMAQPFATPASEQSRQRWPTRAAEAVKGAVDG